MKKLYFLFTFLLVTVSYGQELLVNGNFESWDDPNTPTGWTHVESVDQESTEIHGGTYSAKHTGGTSDLGQTITGITPGTSYTVSLWYKVEAGTGDGNDVRIWSYWRDASSSNITDSNTDSDLRGPNNAYFDNNGNVWTQYSVTVIAPAGANEFYFEVRTYSGAIAYWDDFSFFQEATTTPTIAISSPADGTSFAPGTTSVDVEWSTAGTTGTETVDITVNGTTTNDVTSPFTIPTTDGQSYNVIVELVDGSVIDSDAVSFSVGSITQVSDIASLRAGTIDEYYELTGEAIITFVTGNSRNQVFIQDATAGILIDDNGGIITTSYNNGDGITGLKGQLGEYANVMQIIPSEDPGVASSTGNSVTPQVVTINDLETNLDTYESELVQINDVTFADGDGVATFASSTNYDISDQSGGPFAFRTNYPNDNMAGELIPDTVTNIIVLAGEFFGTPQVYPRQPDEVLSVNNFNSRVEFNLYPNPTSTGSVNIVSTNSAPIQVKVFDILGKQVKNETINSTLNVSGLKSGIYILNITQEGHSVTKKLVID